MIIRNGRDLKRARKTLGWTINDLAYSLRLSAGTGNRTLRRMEAGDNHVTGPIAVATEAFLSGFIPEQISSEEDYD
jgi:hypothetical protein